MCLAAQHAGRSPVVVFIGVHPSRKRGVVSLTGKELAHFLSHQESTKQNRNHQLKQQSESKPVSFMKSSHRTFCGYKAVGVFFQTLFHHSFHIGLAGPPLFKAEYKPRLQQPDISTRHTKQPVVSALWNAQSIAIPPHPRINQSTDLPATNCVLDSSGSCQW